MEALMIIGTELLAPPEHTIAHGPASRAGGGQTAGLDTPVDNKAPQPRGAA